MKVKVKNSGRWADPQPSVPQIEVEAGQVVEVSAQLGEIMINAGAAELVKEAPAKQVKGKQDKDPGKQDKVKAEGQGQGRGLSRGR